MARDRFVEYARDKAIRRLEGLRASLQDNKWEENSRRNIETRMKQLENAIWESRTYADGKRIAGHTKESTRAAAEMLERLADSTGTRINLRKTTTFGFANDEARNQIFKTAMNIASTTNPINVTIGNKSFEMNDFMVRAFYRFYQPLWNTGSVAPSERNKVILQKTGFRTLEEAFAVAMGTDNNYETALMLERLASGEGITDEEALTLYGLMGEDAFKRYRSGEIAANIEETAVRDSGSSAKFSMTQMEIEAALRNFLGNDYDNVWDLLYDDESEY